MVWQGKARQGKAGQGWVRLGQARQDRARFNLLKVRFMKIFAKISVTGTKPILFHTFPIDVLSEKQSKTGGDEWKNTVLMNENRQLYVLNTYFRNAICDGGKEIKVGKGNLSKKMSSTLEIEEIKILLNDLFVPEENNLLKLDSEPVYLDVRSVVNPATKGRNLRYRIAAKTGWKCSFTITWDDYIASKEQVKTCVENGGAFQGIGDGRKIGFGRFKLLEFDIIKK